MANKLYEEEDIRDIAVAIREGNGTENTYDVSEMADAVRALTNGDREGIIPIGSIEITTNGTHDVTDYASAVVNVSGEDGGVSIGTWHTGTFSYEEQCAGDSVITVIHNLGFAPTRMVVWLDGYTDLASNVQVTIGGHILSNSQGHIHKKDGTIGYSATCPITNITETSFDFGGMPSAYAYPAGSTYRWFALE